MSTNFEKLSKIIISSLNPSKNFNLVEAKPDKNTCVFKSNKFIYKVHLNPQEKSSADFNSVSDQLKINKKLSKLGITVSCEKFIRHVKHKLTNKVCKVYILKYPLYSMDYQEWIDDYSPSVKKIKEVNTKFINPLIKKLHVRDIIHGDLHSKNIVLKLNNKKVIDAKIIDFEQTFYPKITPKSRMNYLVSFLDIYNWLDESELSLKKKKSERIREDIKSLEKVYYK